MRRGVPTWRRDRPVVRSQRSVGLAGTCTGILGSLDESTFDADPGGGEWTIREAIGHLTASQRSYAWFSAWWLARRDSPFPDAADPSHGDALPTEEAESGGSVAVVIGRIDALVDLASSLWSPADADTLSVAARWRGFPVTLGFRTHPLGHAHGGAHPPVGQDTRDARRRRSPRLIACIGCCAGPGRCRGRHLRALDTGCRMAASDAVAGNAIRVAAEGALALVRDGASTARWRSGVFRGGPSSHAIASGRG